MCRWSPMLCWANVWNAQCIDIHMLVLELNEIYTQLHLSWAESFSSPPSTLSRARLNESRVECGVKIFKETRSRALLCVHFTPSTTRYNDAAWSWSCSKKKSKFQSITVRSTPTPFNQLCVPGHLLCVELHRKRRRMYLSTARLSKRIKN